MLRVTRAIRTGRRSCLSDLQKVDCSFPWEFAIRELFSRISPTHRWIFDRICSSLESEHRTVLDRFRSACFTICSTIFSTKIASRQQALLHHCYRKFVWIFNRRALEFMSHARSRRGVLFFSGRVSSKWQSEKWRKRLRKESVKSYLEKICWTIQILPYHRCHLRCRHQTTRETNISPDGKLQF